MSNERAISAIMLAAGQGSRMRSERPKPLHSLCGKPMLSLVLDALVDVTPREAVIVIGHKGELVKERMGREQFPFDVVFATQHEQLGTGDAAKVGLDQLRQSGHRNATDDHDIIVLPGDAPLLQPSTIATCVQQHRDSGASATLLSAEVQDPTGYGRVVRGINGNVERIVEHRDASPQERAIREINTSIYVFKQSILEPAIAKLRPTNAQNELYLTDVSGVLADGDHHIGSCIAPSPQEAAGVNDRIQLADAEQALRERLIRSHMAAGVTVVDPKNVYVDVDVRLETDVTLFPSTVLRGTTSVGHGSRIGPMCVLTNCVVGSNVVLESVSASDVEFQDGARVGPFVHLEGPASV